MLEVHQKLGEFPPVRRRNECALVDYIELDPYQR